MESPHVHELMAVAEWRFFAEEAVRYGEGGGSQADACSAD
jgi:hypothetical protein